ncbi:aldolase [Alkalispirochaeta sphaeroplastigenens]|uniref:HPr kinase/phosphorylase n=1 Tax=Alkalispirochaeta sphaeroplastigenens TaxID=1187066 RepID=A0A2S4JRX1_9SPIO|nr:HPr(Ser) kinase/phosphatase [Alkalispirochaeta sphaeroplastigenens]POR02266.1 aldolase [Alkalispirochaeta sphaeroplastigenens]
MEQFTVLDLLDLDLKENNDLGLVCIGGRSGLLRRIETPELNRPGLALSGFFDLFGAQRIQIFGRGEQAYLERLEQQGTLESVEQLFQSSIPCCLFTHGLEPTASFARLAEISGCPLLQTQLDTSEFTMRLIRALGNVFAARKTIHATLVEVFGIGMLLLGESGVGKSEAALELIERGHRLVADDAVEIRRVAGNILMGQGANPALGHHMEIRGLGIINIAHLSGVGSIRDKKQVQLICRLEAWDSTKEYDRIGADEQTYEILGVATPYIEVPVKPGRNIPIIIETAAMNERLKKMGYYSAREFNQNVMRWLDSENARKAYLQKKGI